MNFSEYIKKKRKSHKHTQGSLAIRLAEFDPIFADIDANTISRWERGHNEPNNQRQKLCVIYFDDSPSELPPPFIPVLSNSNIEPILDARAQLKRHLNSQRFSMLIGGLPLSIDSIDIEKYRPEDDQGAYLKYIAALDLGILETSTPTTAETIAKWIEHPGGEIWIGKEHGQIVVHLVLLRLKPEVHQQIMTQERIESSITTADLSEKDEPFCLLLVNFFSLSPESAIDVFIEVIQFLYLQRKYALRVGSLLANMDGVKLCKILSMDYHSLGPITESGEIIHQGKNHLWATVITSTDTLLSSPLALKCIDSA